MKCIMRGANDAIVHRYCQRDSVSSIMSDCALKTVYQLDPRPFADMTPEAFSKWTSWLWPFWKCLPDWVLVSWCCCPQLWQDNIAIEICQSFLSGEVDLFASYSRVVRPSELPSGHISSKVQHLATAVQPAKTIKD